jgi:hypothetical protein
MRGRRGSAGDDTNSIVLTSGPSMLGTHQAGRVWDDTAFAAAAARPSSGSLCHMLWPWAHGPSDWLAGMIPEGMMASKKELQEARHQIASGVDEAEMAGSKSAPGDEAHDGDPPERHHHRNRCGGL